MRSLCAVAMADQVGANEAVDWESPAGPSDGETARSRRRIPRLPGPHSAGRQLPPQVPGRVLNTSCWRQPGERGHTRQQELALDETGHCELSAQGS